MADRKFKLPKLQLEHEPGFRFETDLGDEGDAIAVFDSDMDDFNMRFALDVFKDATLSNCICPCSGTFTNEFLTPDNLADLGNKTDRLQMWLDDCATVTQWATDHAREIAGLIRKARDAAAESTS